MSEQEKKDSAPIHPQEENKKEPEPVIDEKKPSEFDVNTFKQLKIAEKDIKEMIKSEETWEELGLPENLIKSLESSEFEEPSQIQANTLSLIMAKKDLPFTLVAQAKNGSGKTLCFLIASVLMIDTSIPFKKDDILYPQAIIIAPNLELVNQTAEVLEKKVLKLSPEIKVEKIIKLDEKDVHYQGGHIMIGTVFSLSKIIQAKKYNKTSLENVKILSIDEADFIISQEVERSEIDKWVAKILPKKGKFLFFSATFSEDFIEILKLKKHPNFMNISVSSKEELTLENILQLQAQIPTNTKNEYIATIFNRILNKQTIIFVNTKSYAEELMVFLREKKISIGMIFGNPMTKEERMLVMQKFMKKEFQVLITTNLVARGVDIRTVNFVINADLPVKHDNNYSPDYDTYLHRNGRTGRFGDCGVALNIVDGPRSIDTLNKIKEYYKCDIKPLSDLKELENILEEFEKKTNLIREEMKKK